MEKLTRMKWIATGLLVLAALVYVVSEKLGYYYVAAFSEAAMVGALADWFAVVALLAWWGARSLGAGSSADDRQGERDDERADERAVRPARRT